MVGLVTVDGASLNADLSHASQGFDQGVALRGVLDQKKDRAAQQQQQAYKGQLTQLIADPNTPQDQRDQANAQLLSIDPQAANQIQTHQINQQQAQQNQLKFQSDQQAQQETQNLTQVALNGTQNPNAQPAQVGVLGGQPQAQGQATAPSNAPQAVTQEQWAAAHALIAKNPQQGKAVLDYLQIKEDKHQAAVESGIVSAISAPPEKRNQIIMDLPIPDQAKQEILQMSPQEQEDALKMAYLHVQQGGKKTVLEQNLIAAGLIPGTPAYQQAVSDATKKVPLIQNNAETEQQKGIAQIHTKKYADVQAKATAAESTIQDVENIKAIDPKTNATAPIRAQLAAVAEGIGLKGLANSIGDATKQQSLDAVVNSLTLGVLNQQSGTKTDFDFKIAKSTIANLGDTPEAFKFKVGYIEASARRDIEHRDFLDQQIDSGVSLPEANRNWNKYIKDTPLISSKVTTEDGAPQTFYQFQQTLVNDDPETTPAEALNAWRSLNGTN
jgi:hypothetical protein